jgi:hypothetical protein
MTEMHDRFKPTFTVAPPNGAAFQLSLVLAGATPLCGAPGIVLFALATTSSAVSSLSHVSIMKLVADGLIVAPSLECEVLVAPLHWCNSIAAVAASSLQYSWYRDAPLRWYQCY